MTEAVPQKNEAREGVPAYWHTEFAPRCSDYVLLIPEINEGARLTHELERARAAGIGKLVDIVLCDGGSTDGSTEQALLKDLEVNTLLVQIGPGHQSTSLRMGMSWALERGYEAVLTIDGNDKDSIEDVPKLIAKIEEGYDFVQASRYAADGTAINTPKLRDVAIRFIHAPIISATAGFRFTDTTNGFRAHSRRYLTNPRVQPLREVFVDYELITYLSVRASQLGMKVCEVGVTRAYPAHEPAPTKIAPISGSIGLMRVLIKNFFGAYKPQ